MTIRWRRVEAQVSVLLCTLGLLGGAALLALHDSVRPADPPSAAAMDSTSPSPAASFAPLADPSRVRVSVPGFFSWAMLDRRTGAIVGSRNLTATSDTMSMVKVWLASDYLTHTNPRPDQAMLADLRRMIVDSDNDVATRVFGLNGGISTIERMVSVCHLTESAPNYKENRWSPTIVSARDVVRLGQCIATGVAAGPQWTPWLLTQMRQVRGEGDFGPRLAFPAAQRTQIAIKNGWFLRPEDRQWHMACLAVAPRWVMSVLLRYPQNLGVGYGEKACRQVATQLFGTTASASPAP